MVVFFASVVQLIALAFAFMAGNMLAHMNEALPVAVLVASLAGIEAIAIASTKRNRAWLPGLSV